MKFYCPMKHEGNDVCPLCEGTDKVDQQTFREYMKLRREVRKLDEEFLDRLARER